MIYPHALNINHDPAVAGSCIDPKVICQPIQSPTLIDLNIKEGHTTRVWIRHDSSVNTYMTSASHGLDWRRVIRRITYDADAMENI